MLYDMTKVRAPTSETIAKLLHLGKTDRRSYGEDFKGTFRKLKSRRIMCEFDRGALAAMTVFLPGS
jgi:hypothetical protein